MIKLSYFYRGGRKSEKLWVHTLIQGLLKEQVLLLAKYGDPRALPQFRRPGKSEINTTQYN